MSHFRNRTCDGLIQENEELKEEIKKLKNELEAMKAKKDTVIKTDLRNSIEDEFKKLIEASSPLIRYLGDNYHSHVTAVVTSTSIALHEGLIGLFNIEKEDLL